MSGASTDLTGVLADRTRWPATAVAGAVVGPAGPVAWTGEIDRPFRLASVTKPIAAYGSLVAVEEGTLDLDEPAGPEGASVRHLLAHAAGYGFDTGPVSAPGRKRNYSNTGFDVLAAHLAARAGMPAQAYVAEAVLEPLGMSATDLGDRSLAHGAMSTVTDLARFARELLGPTLIAPTTLAEATSVQFPGLDGPLPGIGPQAPNDWGLGFELRDGKHPHWTGTRNSPATFGHFGGAGTFLWVDPAVGHATVVLTDRAFGPWALQAWPELSDAVIEALVD